MELKSTFSWDVGELAEKRKAARIAELEAYWKESAPEGESFDLDKGLAVAAAKPQTIRSGAAAYRRKTRRAKGPDGAS